MSDDTAGLESLDDRLMKLADRMEGAGKSEEAEELRGTLANIRETWRGADVWGNVAEDIERLGDAAKAAAEITKKYLDLE
ncbi:hypothetical protein [Amycolatopsis lexingtonensis]|uniref:hypothetical protein n=1 Tax=Amycolatopsis lexingtonensis TaxID=218822 RepID=UPI003F6FF3C2